MSEITLTGEEITEITGKKRRSAQARALAKMGISFRTRPDGLPIVSRSHFEGMMGEASRDETEQPDWSTL